jgi:thiol:disulfide interchange protein
MKKVFSTGTILLGMLLCQTLSALAQQASAVKAEVKKTQGSMQTIEQPAVKQKSAQQGIDFCECSWATAVSKAKLERKAIFVDAYASWCGPCKYMKRIIFTNAEVGDFYNKNFVNMALDWEKSEAAPLHGKYPLRAFPTLMFINPANEEVVAVAEGALDGSNMIAFGNYGLSMLSKNNKTAQPSAASAPAPVPKSSAAPSVPAKKEPIKEDKKLMDRVSDFFKDLF